jgi:hypothetical protein
VRQTTSSCFVAFLPSDQRLERRTENLNRENASTIFPSRKM